MHLSVEEIRKRSILFENSDKEYHKKMNEASIQLCLDNPKLVSQERGQSKRNELFSLSRQKLDQDGYQYRKKRSRSEVFGSASHNKEDSAKKIRMSASIREIHKKESTETISSRESRISLLSKQKERDTELKKYLQAASLENEILKLKREKGLKTAELEGIKKKDARSGEYHSKKKKTTSVSSTLTKNQVSTGTAVVGPLQKLPARQPVACDLPEPVLATDLDDEDTSGNGRYNSASQSLQDEEPVDQEGALGVEGNF